MKNAVNRIKQLRPATLIAMLALFVAIGGTATAASHLINGKNIKKGTVTAKQLKNKKITKGKLKPALVKSLKGKTGPQGPKGEQGLKGAAGANGVVAPTYAAFDGVSLPANVPLAIGTMNLPAGKYMVTSTVKVYSAGTSLIGCKLSAGTDVSETSTWDSPVNGSRSTIPVQMVTSTGATQVTLGCESDDAFGTAAGTVIATPVQ